LKVNRQLPIVLVIVLFLVACMGFFLSGKKKMESVAAPLESPRMMNPQAQVGPKETRVQPIQETLRWERDPFTLPSFLMVEKKVEKQRVPLKLVAVLEGSNGRMAIIDNELVRKGDLIAGERIVEIGKETVTLIMEGSKRVITLREPH
jgi:hypothetical protein